MKLICKPLLNGIMAYWEKVEEAARYTVSLYVNEQIISTKINDRNELYATFNGLAAIDGTTEGLFSSLQGTVASAGRNVVHVGGGGGYSRSRPTHSGMDYYVQIQAENRNGEIIDSSDKQKCTVKDF